MITCCDDDKVHTNTPKQRGNVKKIQLTRGEISERAVGEVQLRDVGSDAGEAFGVVLLLLGGFDALLLLLGLLLVVGGTAADPQTLQIVGGQVAHHALAAAAAVRETGRRERVVEREQHQVQLRGHVHHRHPHLPDAAPGVALLPVDTSEEITLVMGVDMRRPKGWDSIFSGTNEVYLYFLMGLCVRVWFSGRRIWLLVCRGAT